MSSRARTIRFLAVVFVITVVLTLAWRVLTAPDSRLVSHTVHPPGVMGTHCTLVAVEARPGEHVPAALDAAEEALRAAEMRMSTYIELSELSKLNAADAGPLPQLSPPLAEVLAFARRMHVPTAGAFDPTCLPVFRLWAEAGGQDRLPSDADLAAARALCGWDKWPADAGGLRKTVAGAGIGLGGVAKGWAIDRAVEAMQDAHVAGGLVDVGGDIRCFGPSPAARPWVLAIRNPFIKARPGEDPNYFGTVEVSAGAVCTSGNYMRFSEIGGRRYSHIVDPRTARPVEIAPSVTVVAPTAAEADAWATALSVLGPAGLDRLDPNGGVEAMLVVGGPKDYRIHRTDGFAELLVTPPPEAPRE